jgi:hypothetical protein
VIYLFTLAFSNSRNFRLIWLNLKAARDRKPCSFATAQIIIVIKMHHIIMLELFIDRQDHA